MKNVMSPMTDVPVSSAVEGSASPASVGCGCRLVNVGGAGQTLLLEYCPLHAAAPDLLKALKLAELWLANSIPVTDIRGPKPLPIIAAAIAKAESTAPSTGAAGGTGSTNPGGF